jgi:Tol biopolymer transport system component
MDGLPERFAHVIDRCLQQEPEERWQSARDVKTELDWAAEGQTTTQASGGTARTAAVILGIAAVVLAGALAWKLLRDRPATPTAVLNASLLPPRNTSFRFSRNGEGGFAISPDGTMLAFAGRTEGKAQLWVRSLKESESRLIPDSEGAYNPFWSPDSHWIAFFTPQHLKKVEAAGGAVIDMSDKAGLNNKGSWGAGFIIWGNPFAAATSPARKVPDGGGTVVPLAGTEGASSVRFLPDGRQFVYVSGEAGHRVLWLASVDSNNKPRRIGESGEQPIWSAGHMLSVVDGTLTARPFDPDRAEFTGESFPLKAPLALRVLLGFTYTDYSANAQGMLVFPPRANSLAELRWRDRAGKILGAIGAPGEYYTPRISPDGRRVAFSRRDNNNSDIWVSNTNGDSLTRLTFDPAVDENPVWSPDSQTVTFGNSSSGHANLYRKLATGAGNIERLTTENFEQQPLDWSRDGRFLLFTQLNPGAEIMIRSATAGPPVGFLGRARSASKAQFNPGVPRWIAYDFDDSGRREIYVQAFEPGKQASAARWQISNAGGLMPRWRGDGKEIFYMSLEGKMMAAQVSGDGAAFQSSTPQFLFNATPPELRSPNFEYDVSPDGERFLLVEPLDKPEYQPLVLLTNWRSK